MKKTLFLVIFTLFCIGNIQALHVADEDIPRDPNVVEYMPEFPGGMTELMKFIQKNMRYPKIAIKKGIEGRVICQFVVEKDGSLSEICVVRSSGEASLDKEAVRIFASMPKWTPGKQHGTPVRVKYTAPVNFRLE